MEVTDSLCIPLNIKGYSLWSNYPYDKMSHKIVKYSWTYHLVRISEEGLKDERGDGVFYINFKVPSNPWFMVHSTKPGTHQMLNNY